MVFVCVRKQMLEKYIFDCVTFLLKNTCWLPTATCYQVLSSGSRLGNYATVHEFYSEMVLESINNDGREEKKQKKSRNRSATEKLSQWGFNWEVLRLAYPFWVVLSWGQETRPYPSMSINHWMWTTVRKR